MDIEGLLTLVALLFHWRVVLCLAFTGVGAFLLFGNVPGLTGLQAVVLGALGLLPGALWEEAASPSDAAPSPPTTTSVAVLTALVCGTVWGAASSTSMASGIVGAVILAAASWGWCRYMAASPRGLPQEVAVLCSVVAALVFPVAALVVHHLS